MFLILGSCGPHRPQVGRYGKTVGTGINLKVNHSNVAMTEIKIATIAEGESKANYY